MCLTPVQLLSQGRPSAMRMAFHALEHQADGLEAAMIFSVIKGWRNNTRKSEVSSLVFKDLLPSLIGRFFGF